MKELLYCSCGAKADEYVGENQEPMCDECYEDLILENIKKDLKQKPTQKQIDKLMRAIYGN